MSEIQRKIYLLTGRNRFFGQSRKPWVSIDTEILLNELKAGGFEVIELNYDHAAKIAPEIRNSIVFYSFSQIENTRNFLRDLIQILQLQGNLLLPSYELLLCHENKGYQELYKRHLGYKDPVGYYLSSRDEIGQYQFKYPIVLKSISGSNATGVHLVHDKQELLKRIRSMERKLGILTELDLLRRKLFRSKRKYPLWDVDYTEPVIDLYTRHITPRTRFILQEFIPGLDCDYRVIVFWDKYFVTRRMTRKGDWRASGTKLFSYSETPDPAILGYAQKLFEKVGLPVMAMDLGVTADKIHLFEFQALHFGITPIQCGPGYFSCQDGDWVFQPSQGNYEKLIASSLINYLQARFFAEG